MFVPPTDYVKPEERVPPPPDDYPWIPLAALFILVAVFMFLMAKKEACAWLAG